MGKYATLDGLKRFWNGIKTKIEDASSQKDISGRVSGTNPTISDSSYGPILYTKINGITSQDGTPTPDSPIDIVGLVDYVDLISGMYKIVDTNSAVYTANADALCSPNKIYCEPGDVITIEYNVNTDSRILFFNSSGELIDNVADTTGSVSTLTTTAPDNTSYCLINIGNMGADISEVQYATVKINGNYNVTERTCGKNLLDVITSSHTKNGLTITVNDDKSVTINGTATADTTVGFGTNNTLRKRILNKEVILSGCVGGSYRNYRMQIWNYNANDGFIYSTNGDSSPFIFTNSDSVFNLVIYVWSGVTLDNVTFYPMIRYADVDDGTYEPYTETAASIPLDSPLYEGDYIECYADGRGKLVRTMDSMEIDSSLTCLYSSIYTDTSLITLKVPNDTVNANRSYAKCNRFTNSYSNNIDTEHFYIDNGNIHFYINNDRLSNGGARPYEEFIEYTSNNPVYVIYKLSTPVETELTAEQVEQFKNLYSFDNITNLSCDGEVEIMYYKNTDNGKAVSIVHNEIANLN